MREKDSRKNKKMAELGGGGQRERRGMALALSWSPTRMQSIRPFSGSTGYVRYEYDKW